MLEHVGRSTGTARQVVLEVVSRPSATSILVASAWGRQAQWYQNLLAEPGCHVSIGFRRRVVATAAFVGSPDADQFLNDYRAQHPTVWRRLNSLMMTLHDGDPNFVPPLVRLTLRAEN